jgi:hypothetical protein
MTTKSTKQLKRINPESISEDECYCIYTNYGEIIYMVGKTYPTALDNFYMTNKYTVEEAGEFERSIRFFHKGKIPKFTYSSKEFIEGWIPHQNVSLETIVNEQLKEIMQLNNKIDGYKKYLMKLSNHILSNNISDQTLINAANAIIKANQ